MKTKVQRWGNSLGLRIPKSFAEEAHIKAGSVVDLSIEEGNLIVRPVSNRYDLDTLVERITPENTHEPIETGEPVGREAW